MAKSQNTIKKRVGTVLLNYEKTRDSDHLLLLKYWEMHHGIFLSGENKRKFLQSDSVHSILRNRSQIQNAEKRHQASPEVKRKRGVEEQKFRARFSKYNNSDEGPFNYK